MELSEVRWYGRDRVMHSEARDALGKSFVCIDCALRVSTRPAPSDFLTHPLIPPGGMPFRLRTILWCKTYAVITVPIPGKRRSDNTRYRHVLRTTDFARSNGNGSHAHRTRVLTGTVPGMGS